MANPQASHLKAEGNKLFAAGDHVRAASKYTEAIALDGKNAVLFANRAASYLALKRYHDAVNDASKAVEIDPVYVKGWTRLAASKDALGMLRESIDSYNQALVALPKSTISDHRVKEKMENEINSALENVAAKLFQPNTMPFEILSEMAKAHDIPLPGGLTIEKSRQAVFHHPKWGSEPMVRLLFIPEKEDQSIRQVEIQTGPNFDRNACQLMECELSDHVLLYSEDQMAYTEGKSHGVGVGRLHTSYEIFMDDDAVAKRPLNRRASSLLLRPRTFGSILVMKTIFIKSHAGILQKSEDILGFERLTVEHLQSSQFKSLREHWDRASSRY